MVVASQLVAKVSTEGVDASKQQLKSMGETVKETSGGFKSMLGNALSFAGGQAIFELVGRSVEFLKDQVKDSIGAAIEHQDVMEQTAKVLRSTGDASGMTQQSLEALASSLEKTTFFSKDATEQGENMLLTFTNIGKDVFPQATQVMLDMSRAMGQDIKSTAIQMGKALNDPVQGITALSRVGVTFTDQQKQMIQSMVDAGNTAGAQKIVLAELQREFGGSADATGIFGGKMTILKNRLDDVKEQIGTTLLPVLSSLVDHLVSPAIDAGEELFHKVGDAIGHVGDVLSKIDIRGFKDAWDVFSSEVKEIAHSFELVVQKVGPLKDGLGPLDQIIKNLAEGGLKTLTGLLMDASRGLAEMTRSLQSGKGPLNEFAGPLKNIASLLAGQFTDSLKFAGQQASQISKWFAGSGIIKDVGQDFKNLAHVALDLSEIFLKARGAVQDITEHAFARLAPIIEKILPILVKLQVAFDTGVRKALEYIKPSIESAIAAFAKFADQVMTRVSPIIDKFMPFIISGLESLQKSWDTIWPYLAVVLKSTWDIIAGIVQIAWNLVSGIILIGLDLFSGNWKQAWEDVKSMFSGIWDGVKSIASGAWEFIKMIFTPVGQWFHDRWQSIVDHFSRVLGGLGDIAHGIWNNVTGAVRAGFNNVIDLVNNVIGNINSINVAGFGVHIDMIPHLASGTDFFPGGMALLGERGPELAFLPQGARVMPASQTAQFMSSTSGGQNIYLQVDQYTFARLIMPAFVSQVRNQVGIWGM